MGTCASAPDKEFQQDLVKSFAQHAWDDTIPVKKVDVMDWLCDKKLMSIASIPEASTSMIKGATAIAKDTSEDDTDTAGKQFQLADYLERLTPQQKATMCQLYLDCLKDFRAKTLRKVYDILDRGKNGELEKADIVFWVRNERSYRLLSTPPAISADIAAPPATASGESGAPIAPAPAPITRPFQIPKLQDAALSVVDVVQKMDGQLLPLTFEAFEEFFAGWSIKLLRYFSEDPVYYETLQNYIQNPSLEMRLQLTQATGLSHSQYNKQLSNSTSRSGKKISKSHHSHHRSSRKHRSQHSKRSSHRDMTSETTSRTDADSEYAPDEFAAMLAKRRGSTSAMSAVSGKSRGDAHSGSDSEDSDGSRASADGQRRPVSAANLDLSASALALISPRAEPAARRHSRSSRHRHHRRDREEKEDGDHKEDDGGAAEDEKESVRSASPGPLSELNSSGSSSSNLGSGSSRDRDKDRERRRHHHHHRSSKSRSKRHSGNLEEIDEKNENSASNSRPPSTQTKYRRARRKSADLSHDRRPKSEMNLMADTDVRIPKHELSLSEVDYTKLATEAASPTKVVLTDL